MSDIDKKIVFAVAPGATEKDPVTCLLGLPTAAWEYIKDGKTHTLDLTKVLGIPLQIILYGGATHEECLAVIHRHNSVNGIVSTDRRNEDFGINGG